MLPEVRLRADEAKPTSEAQAFRMPSATPIAPSSLGLPDRAIAALCFQVGSHCDGLRELDLREGLRNRRIWS